ncbi:hypothetical protein F2Q68_00025296 [Brassica cretica]|uniref:Uncharacterized protein n=1 Tax=Brassica cretica TaxID=69181 RepID=A0A8S9IEA3_BRACR|nr:hypothetical protein F2Q68_00025296 [Brassica cretica]
MKAEKKTQGSLPTLSLSRNAKRKSQIWVATASGPVRESPSRGRRRPPSSLSYRFSFDSLWSPPLFSSCSVLCSGDLLALSSHVRSSGSVCFNQVIETRPGLGAVSLGERRVSGRLKRYRLFFLGVSEAECSDFACLGSYGFSVLLRCGLCPSCWCVSGLVVLVRGCGGAVVLAVVVYVSSEAARSHPYKHTSLQSSEMVIGVLKDGFLWAWSSVRFHLAAVVPYPLSCFYILGLEWLNRHVAYPGAVSNLLMVMLPLKLLQVMEHCSVSFSSSCPVSAFLFLRCRIRGPFGLFVCGRFSVVEAVQPVIEQFSKVCIL